MDIQDLILVGKLGKTIKIKNSVDGKATGQCLEIRLVTPTAEEIKAIGESPDVAEFVSYFVASIGEKVYVSEERPALREELGKIQAAVLGFLNKQCAELLDEQNKFVEDLAKK